MWSGSRYFKVGWLVGLCDHSSLWVSQMAGSFLSSHITIIEDPIPWGYSCCLFVIMFLVFTDSSLLSQISCNVFIFHNLFYCFWYNNTWNLSIINKMDSVSLFISFQFCFYADIFSQYGSFISYLYISYCFIIIWQYLLNCTAYIRGQDCCERVNWKRRDSPGRTGNPWKTELRVTVFQAMNWNWDLNTMHQC
jgi:hypothetical protein